ncbi:hypothetical protein BDW67DRAFT_189626 [Aspergillus spinulosporus]
MGLAGSDRAGRWFLAGAARGMVLLCMVGIGSGWAWPGLASGLVHGWCQSGCVQTPGWVWPGSAPALYGLMGFTGAWLGAWTPDASCGAAPGWFDVTGAAGPAGSAGSAGCVWPGPRLALYLPGLSINRNHPNPDHDITGLGMIAGWVCWDLGCLACSGHKLQQPTPDHDMTGLDWLPNPYSILALAPCIGPGSGGLGFTSARALAWTAGAYAGLLVGLWYVPGLLWLWRAIAWAWTWLDGRAPPAVAMNCNNLNPDHDITGLDCLHLALHLAGSNLAGSNLALLLLACINPNPDHEMHIWALAGLILDHIGLAWLDMGWGTGLPAALHLHPACLGYNPNNLNLDRDMILLGATTLAEWR